MRTAVIFILLQAAVVAAQDRMDKSQFQETYSILFTRNIFSRDRRPPRPPRDPADIREPEAPPVEAGFVLKGITREHTVVTAFIENLNSGRIETYTVGSPIAQGRIQSLTLDTLVYAVPGHDPNDPNAVDVTQVRIGQSLLGQTGGRRTGFRPSRMGGDRGDASSGVDTTPAAPGSDAASEMLRQLMERRRRELGN